MKRNLVFISSALLVSLTAGSALAGSVRGSRKVLALSPVRAWAAPPKAAQTQPTWGSTEEYNAWKAAADEKDMNKKIELSEAFMKKYPKSPFVYYGYLEEIKAYQQLGQGDKAMQAAVEALKLSPDNYAALQYEAFLLPYVYKPTAPGAADMLARAESDAKKALDLLQKLPKPANVTDEQFNQYVKGQRALFNATLGYTSLQKKDYAGAITYLKAAGEDNPSDNLIFSMLGQAYASSTPPDYDNAIWTLARSVALAKAANSPNAGALEKYYKQVYANRHGSDEGAQDIITQAAASVNPPAGFKVAQAEKHKPTGNPVVDAYYNIEDSLKVGGDEEKQAWAQVKGQPFGTAGAVVGVDPGPSPDTSLVRIAFTAENKAKDGAYDIILRDKQPDAKYLTKGDPVAFQGTLAEYSLAPTFSLTVDGSIDDKYLEAAKDKADNKSKPKPKPRPRRRAAGK
jgi:hypothetical protein